MSVRPQTVVLDNEAVEALADVHHSKHTALLAVLEVTNERRTRTQTPRVVVPTTVRVEAGWDRTAPSSATINRISRAVDHALDGAAANRCVQLRRQVPTASVVDATVAEAAESAAGQPVTIVTSDADDLRRLAAYLDASVVIAVI